MTIALSFNPNAQTAATEARELLAHAGSLFLATGQWDAPTSQTGPKILRQDQAGGPWVIDFTFPMKEMVCNCLGELNFPSKGFSTLATGFWAGPSQVAIRQGPNNWIMVPLGTPGGGTQVRSFTSYQQRDGTEVVFAGSDQGVFAGHYDTAAPGSIKWDKTPELVPTGYMGLHRVMGFAEVAHTLYCSIGEQVFQRNNQKKTWTMHWQNPNPGATSNALGALRGMTAITAPANGTKLPRGLVAGATTLWMANCSSNNAYIVSLDPATWTATELFSVKKGITAYNNFCVAPMPDHSLCVIAGQHGAATACIVKLQEGVFTAWIVLPQTSAQAQLACRTIALSPFDKTSLYAGGYDCGTSGVTKNLTAWVDVGLISDFLALHH